MIVKSTKSIRTTYENYDINPEKAIITEVSDIYIENVKYN